MDPHPPSFLGSPRSPPHPRFARVRRLATLPRRALKFASSLFAQFPFSLLTLTLTLPFLLSPPSFSLLLFSSSFSLSPLLSSYFTLFFSLSFSSFSLTLNFSLSFFLFFLSNLNLNSPFKLFFPSFSFFSNPFSSFLLSLSFYSLFLSPFSFLSFFSFTLTP
jgi:hypothetical protein